MNMEGYTMKEMADILGVPVKTVNMRLFRLSVKPITKDAVYDKSALEAIRNVPGKGRPSKKQAELQPTKKAKNKKAKK